MDIVARVDDPASVQASQAIQGILTKSALADPIPNSISVMFRGANGAVGSRDVATHLIHWYPAKMFHRIPREILHSLEPHRNTVVFDPFCGSGTVLLEGALSGHHTIGIDINPLAQLISRVKTAPLGVLRLEKLSDQIMMRAKSDRTEPPPDSVFDFWFKPEAKISLYRIRRAIDYVADRKYRDFFLVTFTSIVRRSSLADPAIPPPVRLNPRRAKRANARYRRDLERARSLNGEDVFAAYSDAVRKNICRVAQLTQCEGIGSVEVLMGQREASRTGLPSESVDLIVTSPPYCGAQKYVRSLRLEMLWLGISPNVIADIDKRTLGTERVSIKQSNGYLTTADKVANLLIEEIHQRNSTRAVMVAAYVRYLDDFAAECRRVLRSGGNAFVTFGTSHISGIKVDMAQFFRRAAEDKGLELVTTMVDRIPSRGLITKRHSTAGRIDDERVVWLRG